MEHPGDQVTCQCPHRDQIRSLDSGACTLFRTSKASLQSPGAIRDTAGIGKAIEMIERGSV
jgi:hypothetical protein